MSSIRRLLNIHRGEGRIVGLFLTFNFFLGITYIFVQMPALSLFMESIGSDGLPYIYIVIAVLSSITTTIYLRIGRYLRFSQQIVLNLSFILVVTLVIRLVLTASSARWVFFALPIWYEILRAVSQIGYSTLLNRSFNVRQSKRLFGIINIAPWVANVLGGVLLVPIVSLVGTENLFLISAASIGAALFSLSLILRLAGDQLEKAGESSNQATSPRAAGFSQATTRTTRAYTRLVFALSALTIITYFLVDKIYYARLEVQIPDPDRLAAFLGLFGAGQAVAILGGSLVISQVLGRFGLRAGLLAMPVVTTAAMGVFAVAGFLESPAFTLFVIIVVAKFLNRAISYSIDDMSRAILYQPLPAQLRSSAQAIEKGIVNPLATGATGLLLILLSSILKLDAIQLSYVLILLAVPWVLAAVRSVPGYRTMLAQALARRHIGEGDLSDWLADKAARDVLEQKLSSTSPIEVIYALDLMEKADPEEMISWLDKLVTSEISEVRENALRRIEAYRPAHIEPDTLWAVIQSDESADVKGAAIRAYCALDPPDMVEQVEPYLKNADPQLQQAVMVGLLEYGGIEGILAAGNHLLALIKSSDAVQRETAVRVLGELQDQKSFYRYFLQLLRDENLQVRKSALRVAAGFNNPRLWPLVIEALSEAQTATAATLALISADASVYPALQEAFNNPAAPGAVLHRIARIYGSRRTTESIQALKEKLDYPENNLVHQVLVSLNRCGYRAENGDTALVEAALNRELAKAAFLLEITIDLEGEENFVPLSDMIKKEMKRIVQRTFLLLSFIYEPTTIHDIRDNLLQASAEKKAYAIESLDNLLDAAHSKICFPLLEDLPPVQRLARLREHIPQKPWDPIARLKALITNEVPTSLPIRVAAIYGIRNPEEFENELETLCSSQEPLLKETAEWVLASYRQNQAGTYHDKGTKNMLLTIEKALILKQVDFFTMLPDQVLIEIASLVGEQDLDEGEVLFVEGDAANALFVVVSGEIRIESNNQIYATLGANEAIGEMALLEHVARSATATAATPTHLLKLDQGTFDELMLNQPEMARGIIHVLINRLNVANQRIQQEGA